jgi:hypothetical protein
MPVSTASRVPRFRLQPLSIDAATCRRRSLSMPQPVDAVFYRRRFLSTPLNFYRHLSFSIDAVEFLPTPFVFYRRL